MTDTEFEDASPPLEPDDLPTLAKPDEIPESEDVSEESEHTAQGYRTLQAEQLPAGPGVYALCDLDNVPLYVGQSVDGIRARVRRHLTSARSDIIANRMIDIWEIAYVWCWEVRPGRITLGDFAAPEVEPLRRKWNLETQEQVGALEGECKRKLETFKDQLEPTMSQKDRAVQIATFDGLHRRELKALVATLRKERDKHLKNEIAVIKGRLKASWQQRRKAEADELYALTNPLEAYLFHLYNNKPKLLMNGTVPSPMEHPPTHLPERVEVVVMRQRVRETRIGESLRLPRQSAQFSALLDHIINVKNNRQLRLALRAHYDRLSNYCRRFLGSGSE